MEDNEKYIDERLKDGKKDEPDDLNTLKKLGKVKQKAESGAKTFFKFLWDIKLLIIVQLFALVIIGLDKFLTAEWSWEVFTDAEFWNSYILYFIANWCVVIGWIVRRYSVLKSTNGKYLTNLEHIQAKIDIDYDAPFIEEQSHLEDTVRRTEVFNNKVYKKLYDLSVKHHIRDLNEFYQSNGNYIDEATKSLKWPKNGLKRAELKRAYGKVMDLREKLKKSWQKQNLLSQKLKYPRVNRTLITSGLKPSGEFSHYNSYETKTFSTTLKAIAPSSVTFSFIGLVILSFQLTEKEALLSDYLLFFSQIFLIFVNVVLILSSLDSIFDRTHLKSSDERRTDIEKFYRRHQAGETAYTEKEKFASEIIKYQETETE